MPGLEWLHAITAALGALFGVVAGIFSGGWRLGRIEGRLKLHFQEAIDVREKRIEEKLDEARGSFDETLKGLRQKINDVELHAERRFLPKDDFNDFREEYREDMRDLKALISSKTH
jgi:hypothetical protein